MGPVLEGKAALVTGATGGIGGAVARAFADAGARVVGVDRREADLVCDLSRADEAERAVAAAAERLGRLDVVFNGAGISGRRLGDGPVDTCTEEAWDSVLAANLKSVFLCSKFAIPALRRAGGGSVIVMGSVSALVGFTRAQDAYTAAKGGLISLTKSLAIQFARERIRCNIIHPGIVDTPLQSPYLTDGVRKEFETSIPLGRIADPAEIAAVALFLASDESSYMTGAELVVDGGFTAG
jgi:NAD(P)-dependent dehydrogenase (short-subunit alcohol dehydrogenase family)